MYTAEVYFAGYSPVRASLMGMAWKWLIRRSSEKAVSWTRKSRVDEGVDGSSVKAYGVGVDKNIGSMTSSLGY
jgi:hypothetical protein